MFFRTLAKIKELNERNFHELPNHHVRTIILREIEADLLLDIKELNSKSDNELNIIFQKYANDSTSIESRNIKVMRNFDFIKAVKEILR